MVVCEAVCPQPSVFRRLFSASPDHAEGRLWREVGSAGDQVRATVEKAKRPGSEEFFIPSCPKGYAASDRHARTEFRHDSCNTAPRSLSE